MRKSHLDTLAEKRADQWKIKKKDAALIIKESEKSQKCIKTHKWHLKGPQKGAINHIFVPSPHNQWEPNRNDIQNQKCQMRVDNPDDIFNILLRHNFTQLLK